MRDVLPKIQRKVAIAIPLAGTRQIHESSNQASMGHFSKLEKSQVSRPKMLKNTSEKVMKRSKKKKEKKTNEEMDI